MSLFDSIAAIVSLLLTSIEKVPAIIHYACAKAFQVYFSGYIKNIFKRTSFLLILKREFLLIIRVIFEKKYSKQF